MSDGTSPAGAEGAQQRPLVIGLTGGVAAGKSMVADRFAELGAPVIDADRLAREVTAPGEPALAEIREVFGEDVLTPAGELDRRALRERVFRDREQRRRLEAIVHPPVKALMRERALQVRAAYCLVVIPLLFETGREPFIDRVLVVDCPPELQVRRLIARDGVSSLDAHRMIAAQIGRERRLAGADDVIVNDGEPEALAAAVERLHRQYLTQAGA